MRYAEFVVPLTKAVQELSKMNDAKDVQIIEQNKKIDNLQNQIDELKLLMQSVNRQSPNTQTNAQLDQNIPNPSRQSTTINFSLPAKFSSATIIVTDNNGKNIKQFILNAAGKGSVSMATGSLANGLYHYTLYMDGKMVDSKKMEIIR